MTTQGGETMIRRIAAVLTLIASPVLAAEAPQGAPPDPGAALLASFKPQTGHVVLPGGLTDLNLGDAFRYLTPGDTQRLIEDGWGNPPGTGEGTLGMIVPTATNPLAEEGWGVVLTYSDDGHISDDDANTINYAELLEQMQKDTRAASEERVKQGHQGMSLAGWAEPPHYDASSRKIYWAKDLVFGDNSAHTLNYYIRVLGREGVLELNAVAGMDQLPQVRENMKQIVTFANFTEGNRYADFNSSTDKVAAYGLAALVAGGVAAKTGLLAKLLALLIAMKKLVLVALAGIAAFFGKLFKKKKDSAGGSANPA